MSYRALYRVFRPQTFAEVRGQDHISTTLKNALKTGRLAHAYLFCGPRGTGKTSSAKILAKAVNCLDLQDGEPCNQCANCRAINEESFMDVLEIDAASNRGIDEIREIRDKVKFAPAEGKRKVYIIDEVHMLTNEAFNALLKTLEEPPEHVLFILATTDPQKIPLTVLSRCQRFDFRQINTGEIKAHLAEITASEGVAISDAALYMIARKASGGMRDAISVLDQCIAFAGTAIEAKHVEMVLGTLGEEDMALLVDDIIAANYGQLFTGLGGFLAQGKDIKQIIRDLIAYSRQLLLLKVAPQEDLLLISDELRPKAQAQSEQLTLEVLGDMINRFNAVDKDVKFSNQPQILLEAALVDVILLQQNGGKKTEVVYVTEAPPIQRPAAPGASAVAGSAAATPTRTLVASENISGAWPAVMTTVKGRSIRVHAFLLAAQPMGLEDGALVLKFSAENKFHHDQMTHSDNAQVLEAVLEEMSGTRLKIKPYLEGQEGAFSREFSIVEEAIALFGADKVVVKD